MRDLGFTYEGIGRPLKKRNERQSTSLGERSAPAEVTIVGN